MRRFYYTTPNRKKLTQEALLNLRKVRRDLDPGVLEHARKIIAAQAQRQQGSVEKPAAPGKVPVDRSKNLSIIMKFLEIQTDRSLRLQVRTLLNEELS